MAAMSLRYRAIAGWTVAIVLVSGAALVAIRPALLATGSRPARQAEAPRNLLFFVPTDRPARPLGPPNASARATGLKRLGSFKIPDGTFGGKPNQGFNYGGTAMSYNPGRNSLYIVGHSQDQLLAEIGIPPLNGTASVLQNFVDPTAGRLASINPSDSNAKVIGGTLVFGEKLVVSAYSYYDGAGSQMLSHFVRSLNLTDPGVTGPVRVGPLGAGFYSGYMGVIPQEWQSRLGGPALTGNGALNVISRTSHGPAVFAFDPERLSATGAQPLVYYPADHATLGPWGVANQYFSGADSVKGVALVPGTSTLLFFGRHGTTFCYGPGTSDESLRGRPSGMGDPWCYDPTDRSKGVHGYPYVPFVWAYDAQDLAAVRAGARKPWDVVPYAGWTLPGMRARIGGAAIDPTTGQIYVSEMFGNGTLPSIHVFAAE